MLCYNNRDPHKKKRYGKSDLSPPTHTRKEGRMRFRILATIGLLLLMAFPAIAAQRLVLVEDFTNDG